MLCHYGYCQARRLAVTTTSHGDERETDDLVKLLKSKRPSGRVLVAAHCSVEHKGSSVSQPFESDSREKKTARSVSGSDKTLQAYRRFEM